MKYWINVKRIPRTENEWYFAYFGPVRRGLRFIAPCARSWETTFWGGWLRIAEWVWTGRVK